MIVDELGLFGGAAVVLIYALIAERGFKTAILAEDGFSKLLATGLTAIFALQAFVIIGGVTRVIPLTGVTLPFISYGGQLDRRQLHPARPAPDDLRQGAAPGAAPERGEDRLMNRQIVKLFGFLLVLYALLFGFTSYWSIFDADSLKANQANRRPLLEEQKIKRGDILADDGSVIARSRPVGKGNNKIYVRHYPQGALFGNPIGYSFVTQGRVGFELSHNDELVGNKTEFLSVLDELQGHAQEGDNVQSSLDPAAQRGGRRRARRSPRLGRRDRPVDGRGQGDGEHPGVRPEPRSRSTSRSSTATTAPRSSTARPRPAIRRARR